MAAAEAEEEAESAAASVAGRCLRWPPCWAGRGCLSSPLSLLLGLSLSSLTRDGHDRFISAFTWAVEDLWLPFDCCCCCRVLRTRLCSSPSGMLSRGS